MHDKQQAIVALASMFFGAKLKGVVEAAGYRYFGAIGESGLLKHIGEQNPLLILIDLGKDDVDIKTLVATITSHSDIPILAFCGHVETQKLEDAKALGCHITTNGAISGSFDTVLRKVLELE